MSSTAQNDAQIWYTTAEAAAYLRTTATAVRRRVARGTLVPDCYGGRGRAKQHMFRRETLDAHYSDRGAA